MYLYCTYEAPQVITLILDAAAIERQFQAEVGNSRKQNQFGSSTVILAKLEILDVLPT